MVTNGEHNGLRMRGNTRPLHILQVRANARAKISKTSVKMLMAMLTPKGSVYTSLICVYTLVYMCHLHIHIHSTFIFFILQLIVMDP